MHKMFMPRNSASKASSPIMSGLRGSFSCEFSALVLAIDGLLAECMEAIAKFKNTTALDASIIAGVQAVHYKIACYRMLKSWAKR